VVLTGAGRAFCYGADADELHEGEGALPTLELLQTAIRDLAELERPVIAAVNGFATGAGLDLALGCDLRVMSERAKLTSAFVRFGLVPDGGSTYTLPAAIGLARASEMVLSGQPIDAATALSWGLVNRVVPSAEVLPVALAWAGELAQGPARAMGRAKRLLRAGAASSLERALGAEAAEQELRFADAEFKEGLRAHAEKRPPRFE
jgi:2-(1,2-epoxy-1,2-dihydrophenyl)acetyl-CoA isomerase